VGRIYHSNAAIQAAQRHYYRQPQRSRVVLPPRPAPQLVAAGVLTDPIRDSPPSASRTATVDDWAYVLVPLTVAYEAYGVIVRHTNDAAAGVYSVAIFLIVSVAMRDQDVSKLVARFADFLRGQGD
jgi:hypothetical protein